MVLVLSVIVGGVRKWKISVSRNVRYRLVEGWRDGIDIECYC